VIEQSHLFEEEHGDVNISLDVVGDDYIVFYCLFVVYRR
jgi:hypothetical protein